MGLEIAQLQAEVDRIQVIRCYLKLTEVPLLPSDVPTLDVGLAEKQRELPNSKPCKSKP